MAGEYIIEVAALRFPGESGLATIDFTQSLALSERFMLEVWIKPDSVQGKRVVLGATFGGSQVSGDPASGILTASAYLQPLLLWLEEGKPAFNYGGSAVQGLALTLKQEEWCHVAIVRSREQLRVTFRQGQQPPQSFNLGSFGDGALALQKLELGNVTEPGFSVSGFNGAFAELRAWNTAHTDQEIDHNRSQQLVGNEVGLVGYWMLDEGTGDSILDSSINTNQGRVAGGSWELTSGLRIAVSPPEEQAAFLRETKSPLLKQAHDQMQHSRDELATAVDQLEALQNAEQAAYDKMLADKATLEERRRLLEERRAEIDRAKAETLKTLSATRQITLANFIERLQDKLAKSREAVAGAQGRNVQGLDSIAMEVKMVPGYGGEGLQLPQPGMRTEPGRLSTLTLRLAARPGIEKVEPKLATVPELVGATELYARRVLGAAGFRVDILYQAAEHAEQHGRVLTVVFEEKAPRQAELDSVVTLVIGQHH